ncbi:hypothetical protein GGR56DRAFT_670904 [Xylariaceae sp. FL0804]|nr:hypothetical protein GGR56DRAFT_670904 [Xylariaceae sp. FL0804]
MWDRLRQMEVGSSSLNRKKLEAWQAEHSSRSSPIRSTPTTTTTITSGREVRGGNAEAHRYAARGGPAPPGSRRNNGDRLPAPDHQQQQHNNQQRPPPVRHGFRNSAYARPPSSVYSQASPEVDTFAAAQPLRGNPHRTDPNDVSPPSSPDISSPRPGPNPGDVSPIDDSPDMSQVASGRRPPSSTDARSNIPMMRRERRKNSDAAMRALRETKSRDHLRQNRPYGDDVRWDPRTGEPTTGPKGRPSQVNPQEFVQDLTSRGSSRSPSQPLRQAQQSPSPFGERVRRKEPVTTPSPEPAPRPEWRGASGRSTLVPPVREDRNVTPLNLPPKSTRSDARGAAVLSPTDSTGSETAPPAVSARGPGAQARQPRNTGKTATGKPAPILETPSPHTNAYPTPPPQPGYPSPPLSDDNSASIKPTPAPQQQQQPESQHQNQTRSAHQTPQSLPALQIPSQERAIRRKPAASAATAAAPAAASSPAPVKSQGDDIHPSQLPPGGFPSDWTQPPSRFSVTTVATSNQAPTPNGSIEVVPSLPTPPPQQPAAAAAPHSSVMDRKRPHVPGYENSPRDSPTEAVRINLDSPYRVASPAQGSSSKNNTPRMKPRPSAPTHHESTLSLGSTTSGSEKMLPLAPPELSAAMAASGGSGSSAVADRVAQLNARLEALANRRVNLHKAIRQMTELMPTDNLLASEAVVRKREAEKRKVEALRAELADVERASYELGLKLHRAYKRMDRDAEYEPTTLWVRRVTG